MEPAARLTRDILRLILGAALVTTPVFLFAEGADADSLGRVAASNGACIALTTALLALVRRGRAELAAQVLVLGLLALVSALASTNGEPVHVNVVNFLLVTVLAFALLPRGTMALVGLAGAAVLVSIAVRQGLALGGADPLEACFEPIAQFLPTYLVILVVLWLRGGAFGDLSRA